MTLNSTLQIYQNSLQNAPREALFEFPFGALDHIGAPLWTIALIGADGALSDGFGYGPDLERAQTSAWGETIEWFHTRESLKKTPRRFSTFEALLNDGHAAIDPLTLNLSAGSDYSASETVLQWLEVTRHPDGAKKWCPIEFVAPRVADITATNSAKNSSFILHPSSLVAVPITNGSGAGPSFEHALAHGILELLQRDGNSARYRSMDRGIVVELDEVKNPQTRRFLQHLGESGIEIMVKLADDDFGMANLYVVGYDRDLERAPLPISLSACGEAVHPDREVALGKALREFCMARSRKAFNHGPLAPIRKLAPLGYLEAFRPASMRSEDDRALSEMRAWMKLSHRDFYEMLRPSVFGARSKVRFSQLPTTPIENPKQLLDTLTQRLNAAGLEIFFADFTLEGSGATVLKAVVPGLEVETMTYERIGARNLARLLEMKSPIAGIGDAPENAKPIRLTAENAAKFPGAWFDSAALARVIGPLYPLYREPGRHVIGFLEES